jgi:hypothetical protein
MSERKFAVVVLLIVFSWFEWCRSASASLDDELQALYAKYTRDSVIRQVERDNPAKPASTDAAAMDGALAPVPPGEDSEAKGLQLFSHQPFKLLIRRTYNEVTSGEDRSVDGAKDSYRATEGAQFAYSHDFLKDGDQWSAIASIIASFKLVDRYNEPAEHHGLELALFQFVPSVSLNRVTNDFDASNHVDELTFRAGVFAQWLGKAGPLRLVNFIGNATYVRDSGFHRGGIVAGELDLEPLTDLPGNRTFYRLLGQPGDAKRETAVLELKWRGRLHSEFGAHTASSGPDDESFFRIGPSVVFTLDPFFLKRLTASVDYGYLVGFGGGPANSHHLLAKVGLILDRSPETSHLTLNATYEDGDTPLVQNRVQTFLLTLGIKY